MKISEQQFRQLVVVVAAIVSSAPFQVFAMPNDTVTRPFQDIMTWLCGPVALLIAGGAMFSALASLVFMGGMYIGRLIVAFIGGVGLLGLGKLMTFMTSAAGN